MSKKYFIFYIIFFYQYAFASTWFKCAFINQNNRYKIGISLISINLIVNTVGLILCRNSACPNKTLQGRFFDHFFAFIVHSKKKGYSLGVIFDKELHKKYTVDTILDFFLLKCNLLAALGSILAYVNYEKKIK